MKQPIDFKALHPKAFLWVLGCLLLVFSSAALAEVQVGTLTLHSGKVKVNRQSGDTYLKKDGKTAPLFQGDRIQTSSNTTVVILLEANQDRIELSSNSYFKIRDVRPGSSQLSLPVGKGKFKINKKIVSSRRRFQLKTINALVGVKGTEFVVGSMGGDTNVLTLEGTVSMASIATPDITVDVQTDQVSQVSKGKMPTAPINVSPKMRETILKSDSPKVFKTVAVGAPIKAEDSTTKKKEKKADKKDKKKVDKKDKKKVDKKGEKKQPGTKEKKQPGIKEKKKVDNQAVNDDSKKGKLAAPEPAKSSNMSGPTPAVAAPEMKGGELPIDNLEMGMEAEVEEVPVIDVGAVTDVVEAAQDAATTATEEVQTATDLVQQKPVTITIE